MHSFFKNVNLKLKLLFIKNKHGSLLSWFDISCYPIPSSADPHHVPDHKNLPIGQTEEEVSYVWGPQHAIQGGGGG